MEVKTIKISELSKKAFEVHTSIRNMKRMFAYQLEVAKVSDGLDEDDVVGQISASLKGLDETLAFIRAILNLDDDTYEKLLDLNSERVQKISEQITGHLLGLTDEQLEDAKNPKE
nr:MAG TPA: tail assembly chaperone protein [Caudoviricetes sp.]